MLQVPKTMQAVVYRGMNDLRVETVPVPRIGPNDLLVKVAVCGVCPTDIKKIQHGTLPPPRIFGHETAGTVVERGARVRGFKPGDRVALHHHVPCRKCHACRHRAFAQCPQYKKTGITAGFEPAGGGYAEYVRVMPFVFPGIVKIPPRNSFDEGAMLEPVNTVLKAVRRLNVLAGDCVLVAGQGPIGLLFTRLLALQNVEVIATDLIPERLKLARSFGAKVAVDPGEIGRIHRKSIDAAVVTAPSDIAVLHALDQVRGAGQVLVFAHTTRGARAPIDLSKICADEKDLIGSYSSDFTLQKEVARLVFSRRLDVRRLITHRFPLRQTPTAIGLGARPSPESLKIVVDQTEGG
jgi:L-iditol 2-dehydrogenase